MARLYTIKESSLTGGAMTSLGPRSIQNGQVANLKILASDDARELFPYEVSEQDVIEDTVGQLGGLGNYILYQIPKMNEDVLTVSTPDGVKIQPWLYCTNKRCQRDPGNRLLFHLTCEFTTGNRRSLDEDELYLLDRVDSWRDLPYLTENVYSGDEVVLWEENVSSSPLKLQLPTGSQYSEPFMTKLAKRTIRQTQFEEIGTEDELHTLITDRLFSVPVDNWPIDETARPTNVPPRWMIVAIDYQKTRLRKTNGSWMEGYMMTYTLDYKTPAPPSNPRDGGFWDRRALIDNYVNKVGNDPNSREAVFDDNGGNAIILVNLNKDGTRRDPSLAVEYEDYKVQPEIAWFINPIGGSGFLRTATPQP